jgi:hypothetical protein
MLTKDELQQWEWSENVFEEAWKEREG